MATLSPCLNGRLELYGLDLEPLAAAGRFGEREVAAADARPAHHDSLRRPGQPAVGLGSVYHQPNQDSDSADHRYCRREGKAPRDSLGPRPATARRRASTSR